MVREVPLPNTAFLQMAVIFAQIAYDGIDAFKAHPGTVLFYNSKCAVHQPVIYVYKYEQDLFIITRGSFEPDDFTTDTEFDTIVSEESTYHGGFYTASQWVWEQVKDYIANHDGPIHFTGHSYGGAVSQVMHTFTIAKYPTKEVYSYGFGTVPTMDVETSKKFEKTMWSFVNDNDIIPTLSIPNVFERIKLLSPIIAIVPSSMIVSQLRTAIALISFTTGVEEGYYNMLWNATPTIVQCAKNYEAGKATYVRYVAGTVFQVDSDEPKALIDCVVDPTETLHYLSLTSDCIDDHTVGLYASAVEHLIW